MAIPSGLSAQLGIALETTYGTFATPTKFVEFDSEGLQLDRERINSAGLGRSTSVLHSDNWKEGKRQASGPVSMDAQVKGFNIIFEQMLGASSASQVSGGSSTYDNSHTITDLKGTSGTWQIGRPDVNGVVHPFSYTGVKVMDWELTNSIDEFLKLNLTLDAQDESLTDALATKSFASNNCPLPFTGATITVNGATYVIQSISIKGVNSAEADRFGLSATKEEPIQEALREITIEFTIEFESLVAYNLFNNGTTGEIVAKWQGPTAIEASLFPFIRVTLPKVRYDGPAGPVVEGPGRLTQTFTAMALNNGTDEPITLVYRSEDADTYPSRSISLSPSLSVSLSPSLSISLTISSSPSLSASLSASLSPSPS